MSDSKDYNHWINYAANDLAVANDLHLQKEYVYHAVVTHCQQSVEKYLKAFLLFNNTEILYTHDLLILCKLCERIDEDFGRFKSDLNSLSVDYRESRYPGDFEDITLEDAKDALETALKFQEFILPKFALKK
jgi:HEPN domain-containing protein